MKDWNVCEHCSGYVSPMAKICPVCEQPLVLEAGISLWRLGEVRDGVLGPLVSLLKKEFSISVVIQPAYLDERASVRPGWRGISSTVFLNQAYRRHIKGGLVSLGVTEKNIVPSARYNFLFGYAYIGLPGAVVSLHPLLADEPSRDLLVSRLAGIAIHEIGHTLGLDHHGYRDGVDCVMVGDEAIDSLTTIDEGSSLFCNRCRRVVERRVQRLEAAA